MAGRMGWRRLGGRLAATAFAVVSVVPGAAVGRPGDTDPAFGGGGIVRLNLSWGRSGSQARAVVRQGDGKFVAAGNGWNGSNWDFALARFESDGRLDRSFGRGGRVMTALGNYDDQIAALILLRDGKLIAAGRAADHDDAIPALVRYEATGQLDSSFGHAGRRLAPFGGPSDALYALAQQPDGKVVALGNTWTGSDWDLVLFRLNADGGVDGAFGQDGKIVVASSPTSEYATALAVQPDGKLVAGGFVTEADAGAFLVMRFNADGSIDRSFGVDGRTIAAVGGLDARAYALVVQADGKLLAAGAALVGGRHGVALARFQSDGSLDQSFGSGGTVVTSVGKADDFAMAATQLRDGTLAVAGQSSDGSRFAIAVLRYNPDGTLDGTFGAGGVVVTAVGDRDAGAHALAEQPDGGLVVAGEAYNGHAWDFALARFDRRGALDASFGRAGIVTMPVGAADDHAYAVLQQADGKVVAAGETYDGSRTRFAVLRCTENGGGDESFGEGGRVITEVGAGESKARALVQQADGKLAVAGSGWNGHDSDFALARYLADGRLDERFGTQGKVVTGIGGGEDEASALVQQGDGKLVAGGSAWNGRDWDFALARYQDDGALDRSFGAGGKVVTQVGASEDRIYTLVAQPDGKLVAAGYAVRDGLGVALARYLPDGRLDPSFGSGGKVVTVLGGADWARALVRQPDGKLVAAGCTWHENRWKFLLLRYAADGALDAGFGTAGVVVTPLGQFENCAEGLVVQPDGRLVAVGFMGNHDRRWNFVLARYNADGSRDASFGDGGFVLTRVSDSFDYAHALTRQSDGKVVAAGYAGADFALVRYLTAP